MTDSSDIFTSKDETKMDNQVTNILDYQPHCYGWQICMLCGYEQMVVVPEDAFDLPGFECTNCGSMYAEWSGREIKSGDHKEVPYAD